MKNILLSISILIFIAIFIAIGFVFFSIKSSIYDDREANLTIKNLSGSGVSGGKIELGSRTCKIDTIKTNNSFICKFTNLTDSSYSATLKLEDGRILESENMGYVTGGISWDDLLLIDTGGNVILTQHTVDITHNKTN